MRRGGNAAKLKGRIHQYVGTDAASQKALSGFPQQLDKGVEKAALLRPPR